LGVSLADARQDIASIGDAWDRESPVTHRDCTVRVDLLSDPTVGKERAALWFLMRATLLFRPIGRSNVANLLPAEAWDGARNSPCGRRLARSVGASSRSCWLRRA
jgi:hypothetical protein